MLELNATGRFLSNFSAYNARWPMPGPESGGVLAMWYSFDYADAHFVSIDTSTDFPGAPEGETGDSHMPWFPAGGFAPNGTYMRWLEADLKAARARNVRWLIAGGHRPTEDFDSAALLALFKAYGVDVYFAGHGHRRVRKEDTSAAGTDRPRELTPTTRTTPPPPPPPAPPPQLLSLRRVRLWRRRDPHHGRGRRVSTRAASDT